MAVPLTVMQGGEVRVEGIFMPFELLGWVGEEFARQAVVAKARTGMDLFKLSQLWLLATEAGKAGEGAAIEVGCGRGGSGYVVAAARRHAGAAGKTYLCDTFEGIVKSVDGEHQDGAMDVGETRLGVEKFFRANGFGQEVIVIQGVFPEERQPIQESERFNFAHLDVDTYRSMRDAFQWVWPRMIPGAICVIDDFGVHDCPFIQKFVLEEKGRSDAIWAFTGGDQALAIKQAGRA